MNAPEATSVACPDCQAPEGEPCRVSEGWPDGTAHASRITSARLHAVDHGICALCHTLVVRGQREEDGPIEVWHPDPDTNPCPPLPNPQEDWNAYATAINLGARPGFPGPENFRPLCTHVPPFSEWPPDVGAWDCRDCDPPQITYRPEPDLDTQIDRLHGPGASAALDAALADGSIFGEDPRGPLCPECAQGKVLNCAGQALVGDDLVPCANAGRNH